MEQKENFDKPFKEVPGGHYDSNGFYINPDHSFYDPDKVYFNAKGFDKHGGYYDGNLEYQPGKGWIPELMCYEDEKEAQLKNAVAGDEDEENDDILDQLYLNDKNFEEIINENNVENIFVPSKELKKEEKVINNQNITKTIKEEVISPEMLFNKIPDNKKPDNVKKEAEKEYNNQNIVSEQKLELDSLFA